MPGKYGEPFYYCPNEACNSPHPVSAVLERLGLTTIDEIPWAARVMMAVGFVQRASENLSELAYMLGSDASPWNRAAAIYRFADLLAGDPMATTEEDRKKYGESVIATLRACAALLDALTVHNLAHDNENESNG